MDGVLVIDKPAGMTSHDVVDRVRKTFGTRKVGHAGTLDPDATGVLVLGLGRATRFLSYSQDAAKSYRAVGLFGVTTSTQDASGEVIQERSTEGLSERTVADALDGFTGEIEQVPPMVSAVRIGGERLYEKARRGEEVERPARKVTIYTLDLVDFTAASSEGRPEATLDVRCSSGTYIRTLVHDLGESLGCGAHLVSLVRTEAGGFTLEDALPLEDCSEVDLRPLTDAVKLLPALDATPEIADDVRHGRKISGDADGSGAELVAVIEGGDLLGVYRRDGDALRPERVVGS